MVESAEPRTRRPP